MAILTGGNDMREQTIWKQLEKVRHGWHGRESDRSTWGTPTSLASSNPWIIKTLQPWKLYDIADILYRATVDDYQEPPGLCTRNLFYYTVISWKGNVEEWTQLTLDPFLLAIPACSSETTGYQRPLQTIAAVANTTGQSRAWACVYWSAIDWLRQATLGGSQTILPACVTWELETRAPVVSRSISR